MQISSYKEINYFWFEEIESSKWWLKDPKFDQLITHRFGRVHAAAKQCELTAWRESPQGRLAEIIVLDQFSRNMYRDQAQAFACDALALCLAQHAVDLGMDKQLTTEQRNFLYMPYMHSESVHIHERAVELFAANDSPKSLEFEIKHKVIIDRFGRYPHRNSILKRRSTDEELAFLKQDNSSF